ATPSWRSTASNRPSNGPGNGRRWTVTAMRYWNCGAISNRGISPPVRWWRHTSSSRILAVGDQGFQGAAMTFYHQTIGGALEALITYGETPAAAEVPPEAADLIIHGSLNIRGRRLMGADMAGECQQVAQGTCIHLEYDDQDRAAEVFDQLQ